VKPFDHRMQRIEAKVLEADDPAAGDTGDDLGSPSDYRLIVCHVPGESVEEALGRWGLQRTDIPAGVFLYLGPCFSAHRHTEPVLLRCWRHGPPRLKPQGDLDARLQEVLALSEEERERERQARWERDRETLRTLASRTSDENAP
jgi:hypothetical protein